MYVLNLPVSIGLLFTTLRITIANPKWVKAIRGNKDDTNDSKWIGDLFRFRFSTRKLYSKQTYSYSS
jgi:hypothetical protein